MNTTTDESVDAEFTLRISGENISNPISEDPTTTATTFRANLDEELHLLNDQMCRLYGVSANDLVHSHLNLNPYSEDDHTLTKSTNISHNLDLEELNYFSNATVPEQGGGGGSSLFNLTNLDILFSPQGERNTSHNVSFCSNHWDGILCWPETPVGYTATQQCLTELKGINYDISQNATRFCEEGPDGGMWNNTDYDLCLPIGSNTTESYMLALTTGAYFCGYCLSLAAATIAMIIFLGFKELRCLRNTIHTHLIVTYILADTMWIIASSTTFTSSAVPTLSEAQTTGGGPSYIPCVTYIIMHYFHLTNFFWMFVEGLYLYVLVVQTFVAENIRLRYYVTVGWGVPLKIVIIWVVAKWYVGGRTPTRSMANHLPPTGGSAEMEDACVWLLKLDDSDWLYKGPVILTLVFNSLFLLQIMWVLITKLQATSAETQQSMKAAKALVVLMPLLGITYLLMLAGVKDPVYEFIRALLISTQGFLVALLYCFLNGEVRKALRHKWGRVRTVGCNCCNFGRRRRMPHIREFSPRSRTESIRLYNPVTYNFRKRESSASDATTITSVPSLNVTAVNTNGNHRRLSSTIYANKFQPSPVLKEEPTSINSSTFI